MSRIHDLKFYRFIMDSLPVGIVTVDSERKITSLNPWAEEIIGYSEKEALGRFCGEIMSGGRCRTRCPLKTVISRENPVVRLETTVQTRSGETIPVRMNTAALLDDQGSLIGGVEAFQDISYLKALERERDSFISMFAHDMKSSITIIGGFVLRLLKKSDGLDPAKREKYLEIVRNETGKLESMIKDFLEFSRLQTGRLKLDFAPTSLDKELMELIESFQVKASQSGVGLELETEDALPLIEADSGRLRRVFANLLDNAIKFSKKGGKVIVRIQEAGEDVSVRVIDQGMGIYPEDIPYIFDPFRRGKGEQKSEGFGLGLAAVKVIVEGHGGSVHVESELGKGSEFQVILPKKARTKERESLSGFKILQGKSI